VVSHDPDLLDALHLTHRLDAGDHGWVLHAR
jgi:hypothetical protein